MTLNKSGKLLILSAILVLLCGCEAAVSPHKVATYHINGDPKSALYPVSVKEISEDVVIQLPESAPASDVFSVDEAGKPVAFNFTRDGSTIVVPGKFDHLVLSRQGVPTIDRLRQQSH